MGFKEKIDKILNVNTLEITSVSVLEDFVGAGRGAINDFYKEDREPGRKTLKRILGLPGLSLDWWETGKGEVFCHTLDENITHDDNKPAVMEKPEKTMQQTIDGLIAELKEAAKHLREENAKLNALIAEQRADIRHANDKVLEIASVALANGKKK